MTGATGGIGQAIARALHARGASVVLTGRRREVLEGLAAELGERAEVVEADLADPQAVRDLAERGTLDVLVANAALPASGPLDDYSPEEIDRALDVNLRGPIQLAAALAPGMVERGHGHLVFVNSISGKSATAGSSLYSATKFGLRGFATGLRGDLHGTGVGVSTVFPGFISGAGMFAETGLDAPVPTRTPEDVADGVIRAIERNRLEVDVAPMLLRLSGKLSGLAPGATLAISRRFDRTSLSERLGEAQRSKR